MDIRVLRYFLAVAQEETISKAAEVLHVSQPALSRQLADLEREVGKPLFNRGSRKITLTEEGKYLRRKAREIVALQDETLETLSHYDDVLSGEIRLGGAETEDLRIVARAIGKMRCQYPQVTFRSASGQASTTVQDLESGSIDFGFFVEPADLDKFDCMQLPGGNAWGVLTRKDSSLALLDCVRVPDLRNVPLICSAQALRERWFEGWLGHDQAKLDVIMTYDLLNTSALAVEEGVGHAICFEGVVRLDADSNLCFRPFRPKLESRTLIAWQKGDKLSVPAKRFLGLLRSEIQDFG